ncbi:uncharacterized protein LOC132255735 [Phlebotomus argentipes]|uniref:uncharacterized protein LOC132255735 n=1 Tax=Phlebotomus argentipes TaxID=94469 RepID=UPI002892F74D|nr:uncharacterized protein LOC132255735 [Phlebotomus argentipes]XP_059607856.1 uncharacterized protein LOC132255735 [Phlebotomus argentipes]
MIHFTRCNKRKLILYGIVFLVVYAIFSSSYNEHRSETTIANAKPEKVWEFVADFSKMKLLNPTILDFYITSDTGNADHWRYSVTYTEKLAHWPHWLNSAEAEVSVRRLSVDSSHRTCFFYGLYCLRAEGGFAFAASPGGGTHVVETVRYQCPPFLGRFCRAEVQFQRNAIMNNLSYQFNRHLL